MTTKLLPACLAVLAACSDSSQPSSPDGGSVLTPGYEWSYHFGGTDEATPNAVAIGQDGAAYLSGSFKGTDDFGKGPLTSVGYHDIYFAKYDASRTALFAKRFGSTGSSALAAMAQDRDGNLYLVGSTASGTDFGGGGLPEGNFVASFAPSGAHRFSAPLGKGGTITSFAVDGAGNLYLCGSFPDTINLGGDPLTSAGALDLFLASYTATGAHRFSKPLGGSVNEENCRIAVDAAGNIFLAGDTWGTTNLGGKDLTSAGYSDILLASFTPSGDHRFSKRFGSDRPDSAGGLLVDAGGNLYLTGDFGNTISFGGESLGAADGQSGFLASFSPSGDHRFSHAFPGYDSMRGGPLALDGEGNVYLVGSFMSFVDLGQGQLKGWSASDIYLASFTASGAYRFGKVMGGQGNDTCSGLAVSADGKSLYLAGSFADSIDFGGGSEASGKPQRWDATIFLVKLAVTSTTK